MRSPKKRRKLRGGGYEEFEDSESEGKGGSLTVTTRVSNGASRYAMPTIPRLVFAALLYPDGNPPATPQHKDFVEGVPNGERFVFSFQRPDETENITFTLEVFAFVKTENDEASAMEFSKETSLLSGKKDTLKIDGDTIEIVDTIALSSMEQGTVDLKIKVPDGCSLEINDTTHFVIEGASPNFTIKQNDESEISAGAYQVTFTVKKKVGESEEIICLFSENINVFNGMCTDTWWNGDVSSEVKDVALSMPKTVYVRGVGGWYDTHSPYNDGETATADDANLGSFSSPFATIQKAIDKVIAMNDGTSEYTIKIDGTVTQSTPVTNMASISPETNLNLKIESLSANTNATLDAANNGRVMYTGGKANVKLKNIHITGGYAGNGGGIYNNNASVTVELSSVTISNCTTTTGCGGGIANYNGTFIITDSTFTNCTTGNCGGGIYNAGTLTVIGGAISNCNALGGSTGFNGGGVYNAGTLTLSGISVTNCNATTSGGGIYSSVSDASIVSIITNCEISGCKSTSPNYGGGGIAINTGKLELTDVTITGGNDSENPDASNGGGIYISKNGTLKMAGGAISGCNAGSTDSRQGGGGIYSEGTFSLSSVTISGCSAGTYGGGILARGTSDENIITNCTITNCRVEGSSINNYGGGMYVGGKLTVEGTTISGCVVKSSGGGVFVSGSAEIKGCTITGCKANNGGGIRNDGTLTLTEETSVSDCNGMGAVFNYGSLIVTGGTRIFDCTEAGGIYNSAGSLEVDDCTISNCTSSSFGGIYIPENSTSATISSCIITDCHATTTATNNGSGGGINNELASTEIKDCTITNCTAIHHGGGIYNDVSDNTVTTTITNCTISGCRAIGMTYSSCGGGIFVNSGALKLTNVTITGRNDIENLDGYYGGGIYNMTGTLTFIGGTISENTARLGGGVFVNDGGTFTMEGGAITGNAAKSWGGGVYISKDGTFTIDSGTISENTGTSGGGVYVGSGGTFNRNGGTVQSD